MECSGRAPSETAREHRILDTQSNSSNSNLCMYECNSSYLTFFFIIKSKILCVGRLLLLFKSFYFLL